MLGIPESDMILENQADSTYQNVLYTCDILRARHMDEVLVVTSEYHTRRTQWMLNQVYTPAGIQFVIIAADDPEFIQAAWWSSNKSAMNTVKEYIKLVGYLVRQGN